MNDKSPSIQTSPVSPAHPDVSTSRHASRYLIIGVSLAIFNFVIYTIIVRIINNNDYLWAASLIASFISTILAYILHSKITWKERNPSKTCIIKFFVWNAMLTFLVSPFLTWLFSLITPLYQFAFNISSAIHLPFDYEFVQSTGVFLIVAAITTIFNFFFYDKFVFGNAKKPQ